MSEHAHAFKMTLHLDGCHFYESHFACACGTAIRTYDERDVDGDPYSAVWMEDVGQKPCARCAELLAGAEPKHDQHVFERGARNGQ